MFAKKKKKNLEKKIEKQAMHQGKKTSTHKSRKLLAYIKNRKLKPNNPPKMEKTNRH